MYRPRFSQPNVRFPSPQHGYNQQGYNSVQGSQDFNNISMSPHSSSPSNSWNDRLNATNSTPPFSHRYGVNTVQSPQNYQMYHHYSHPSATDFYPRSLFQDPNTVTFGKRCNCGAVPPKSYCPCVVRVHGTAGLQKSIGTQTESSIICSYVKADFFKLGTQAFNHLSDAVRNKRDELASRNTWTKPDIENAAFEVWKTNLREILSILK